MFYSTVFHSMSFYFKICFVLSCSNLFYSALFNLLFPIIILFCSILLCSLISAASFSLFYFNFLCYVLSCSFQLYYKYILFHSRLYYYNQFPSNNYPLFYSILVYSTLWILYFILCNIRLNGSHQPVFEMINLTKSIKCFYLIKSNCGCNAVQINLCWTALQPQFGLTNILNLNVDLIVKFLIWYPWSELE